MATLKHVVGDATQPQGEGHKVILHVANNVGAWGAGFVLALSKRWQVPEQHYRQMFKTGSVDGSTRVLFNANLLGTNQYVAVERGITVVNMMAQDGVGPNENGRPPIRYSALAECLKSVRFHFDIAQPQGPWEVHAPRFGAGLSGGNWEFIEALIQETLVDEGINVTIYAFPGSPEARHLEYGASVPPWLEEPAVAGYDGGEIVMEQP